MLVGNVEISMCIIDIAESKHLYSKNIKEYRLTLTETTEEGRLEQWRKHVFNIVKEYVLAPHLSKELSDKQIKNLIYDDINHNSDMSMDNPMQSGVHVRLSGIKTGEEDYEVLSMHLDIAFAPKRKEPKDG